MPIRKPPETPADELRRKAEEKVKATADRQNEQKSGQPWDFHLLLPKRNWEEQPDDQQTAQLLYELRVHHAEIEMQNEELRRTQLELEAERSRYFSLYDLAPVGYCTVDQHGLLQEANLAAATLLGVSRSALVKQPISRFIDAEDQDTYYLLHKKLIKTGDPQSCELRMVKGDGQSVATHLTATGDKKADGTTDCRIVIIDITERKQKEDALRQSEAKYRTVADFTYDWEFWLGPEGEFLYCSPSCVRITGQPPSAFTCDPALLRALVHPDDLAAFDQHRHGANEQKIAQEIEFRIRNTEDLTGWRWISHVCQPVYDEHGRFLGIRGSNRDVTARKSLEDEVLQARNLESLGILTGGIAHDFNNLLQGLIGNIELARMYTDESSKAMSFLAKAEQVSLLASKLTSQLIAFSTGGMISPTDILPASHIKEEVASTVGASGMAVEFDLPGDLWPIHVDPAQFRQVIKHMVLNAMEAMPVKADAKLKIMAVNEPVSKTNGKNKELGPGNYVHIAIQDQGCGISREHLPLIFTPYFSTKQRDSRKGMGLGLALCNTIIRKQGGTITVQSKPGQGTTFHIYLPAVVAAERKTEVATDQKTRGTRILVMDDDLSVVKMLTQFLRISGFRVDATLDGDAAIAAYQKACSAGDPYALVILDLSVPGGKGGKEVIAVLKQINPEVKAIVSSGYSSDDAMTDYAAYGFVAACAKPYMLAELKKIIAQFVVERAH